MRLIPKKRSHLVFLFLAMCLGVGMIAWSLVNMVFSPQVRALRDAGITYYSPSYLPDGVSIKKSQLFISSYYSGGGPTGRTVTNSRVVLAFRDIDNVYSIGQFPTSLYESVDDFMGTSVNNYDPRSQDPTCKMVSNQELRYRLCHWYDYGDLYSVYEVKFVKDKTAIRVNLNSPDKRVLNDGELGKFVHSFTPGNPNDLTIIKTFGGA